MPFYDYKCKSCGQKFEALHGMSGPPADLGCEFCGSKNIQRVFHPVGTMRSGGDLSNVSVPSSGGGCSSCSSGRCGSCH